MKVYIVQWQEDEHELVVYASQHAAIASVAECLMDEIRECGDEQMYELHRDLEQARLWDGVGELNVGDIYRLRCEEVKS